MNVVIFKKLDTGAGVPRQATDHSSGYDLRSTVSCTIAPGEVVRVPTGLAVEIPSGYEGQIRGRSSIASNHKVMLPNGVGTIDSDYRGEIQVPLFNLSKEAFTIKEGDRIAQIIFCKVEHPEILVAEELSDSDRLGGFGSTGVE